MGFWTAVVVVLVLFAWAWRSGDDSDKSGPGQPGQPDDGRNTQSQSTSYPHSLHAHYQSTYGTISTPSPPTRSFTSPPPYAYQRPTPHYDPPPASRALRSSDVNIVSAPSLLPLRRQTWAGEHLPASSAVLREQAVEEGKLMADSFSQSKSFREAGFRTEARRLSQKGKEHQRAMEAFNKTASEMIFREKNKDREPHDIDLHGLFVKEAELKVEEAILAGEQRGDPVVRFIVGKGLHTTDGMAKLKPALKHYIRQMPRVVEIDPRNAGVLVVSLTLNSPDDQGPTRQKKKVRPGRTRTRRASGRASP